MGEPPRPPVKAVCSDFKPVARKAERGSERKKGVGCLFDIVPTPFCVWRKPWTTTVPRQKSSSAGLKLPDRHIHNFSTVSTHANCCQQLRKFIGRAVQLLGRKMVAKPKKWDTGFYRYPIDFVVVRPAGIEPAAYCLGGNRSIRLSYERASYLVKQSDARCQVEAGRAKHPQLWGKTSRPLLQPRKNPLQSSSRVACDRFRIACAAGAAWGQVRCPWHPAPRRWPPAG